MAAGARRQPAGAGVGVVRVKSADGAPLDTTAFGASMARVESEVALVVDDVLAADIADMVLARYQPTSVRVEVKKFVIPQARYVSVALERPFQ